ncbi:hypothetical protein ACP70R_029654 [Stipagrostis hirtigluma subsp. patula]
MARLRDADDGTRTNRSSGIDVESVRAPDLATAAAAAEQRSATRTALAVAATAAVELTNLFFLLRGDAGRHCRCKIARLTAINEEVAVLFAFAALLPAAGLLLVQHAAPRRTTASAWCWRVLLAASAASLFVASAGTVLSLLRA